MNCAEKLQRNTHDILIIKTEDEEQFRKKFKDVNLERRCTVCDITTKNSFHPHPALRVIVCENCLVSYENTVFLSHKDGTDQNCRWCAKLAERYCCSKCTAVFCEVCLSRNFGNDFINTKITNCEEWSCLFCEPKQLWALRAAYAHAIDAADLENTDSDLWKEKNLSNEVRKLAQEFLIITKNDFQSFADKIQTEVKNFSYIVDETRLGTYVEVEKQVCCIAAFCSVIVKFISQLNEDQAKHFYSWSKDNFDFVPKIDLGILPFQATPSFSNNIQPLEPLINNVVKIEPIENDNHSTSTVRVTDDFQASPAPCSSAQPEAYTTSEIKKELSPKCKFKLSLNKPTDTNTLLSSVSSQDSLEKFLDKIHKPETENILSSISLHKELRVSLVDFRKYPQTPLLIQSIKCEVADNVSIFSKATDVLSDTDTEPFCEEDISPDVQLTTTLCDKTGDFFETYVEDTKPTLCPIKQSFSEPTSSQEDSSNQHNWKAVSLSENDLFTAENTKLNIEEEIDTIEQEVDSQTTEVNNDDADNEEISSVENESASPSFLDRTCAMEALSDSDDLSKISSDSSTSGTSSSSVSSLEIKKKTLTKTKHSKPKPNGYIKTLDLAQELEKLQKTNAISSRKNSRHGLFSNSSSSSESDEDDINVKGLKNWKKPTRICSSSSDDVTAADGVDDDNGAADNDEGNTRNNTPPVDDPKLKNICKVLIAKIDFDHCFGLQRIGSSDVFKILDKSFKSNDKDEFRRLTTLNPLKNTSNSSQSSDDDKPRARKKKKGFIKSKLLFSSDFETDSTISSNSDTDISLTKIDVTEHPYKKDDVVDILMTTDDSDIEYLSSDEPEEIKNTKNKTPNKPKKQSARKFATPVPQWRRDKLLVSSFNIRDPEASTSNPMAEDVLEKEEEIYLQRIKTKQVLKRKKKPIEEDKTISLSDDSSDEDISLLSKKRKLSSEEPEPTQLKIGRKNIREVLDDSQLQAKTQKADKEEEKRKERISTRHKMMDSLLSQSSEEIMKEEMGLVLDIDNETKKILVEIPHILAKRLKKHQTEGIKFMWDICCESIKEIKSSNGAGCILAHCMGLGKTLQVILLTYAVLTNPLINMKHILVVCPLSTVFNWQMEFEKGLQEAPKKINVFDVRPANQKNFKHKVYLVRAWWDNGGVLIMSYESYTLLVKQEKYGKMPPKYFLEVKKALANPGPDMIICDEGHLLKNDATFKCRALSKIKTRRRIILTGTPMQNNLKEYYQMVNFVKPHLLGTAKEFANRFINPIQNGQYEDSSLLDIQLMKKRSHILHKKLETTIHRYGATELKKYLPIKHDYVLYVQLTDLQIKLYEKYLDLMQNTSHSKTLFTYYNDLHNIWTHPALCHLKSEKKKAASAAPPPIYEEDFVDPLDPDNIKNSTFFDDNWFREHMPSDLIDLKYSNKMIILFSIIEECIEFDDKLLVFSSYMFELDLIEGFLSEYNFKGKAWVKGQDFFRLDGHTHPDQRIEYCQSFNDPNNKRVRLFLVSHKVGGVGINLFAANRVVLMDVSWNPSHDTQSVFRIYRFGQTKECYIYRLVSVGTMEELVYTRCITKLATFGRVVDEQQIQRHFKGEDKDKLYILTKNFPEPPPPKLPSDRLVAKLWEHHRNILYKFCDHQSLLENQTAEELNDEEMKIAWEEFRKEEEDYKTAKSMDIVNKSVQQLPKISDPAMSSIPLFNTVGYNPLPTQDRSVLSASIKYPISRIIPPHSNFLQRGKQRTYSNISNKHTAQNDNSHRFKKPLSSPRHMPNNIENISIIHNNNIDRALQSQLPNLDTPPVQTNYPSNATSPLNYLLSKSIYSTASHGSSSGVKSYTAPTGPMTATQLPPPLNLHTTPIQMPTPLPPLNLHTTPIQRPTTQPLHPHTTPIQQSTTVSSLPPPFNPRTTPIQRPMTAPQPLPPLNLCTTPTQRPTTVSPLNSHATSIQRPPTVPQHPPPRNLNTLKDVDYRHSSPSHKSPPRYQTPTTNYSSPHNYKPTAKNPQISNPTSINQIRTTLPMKAIPTNLNFEKPRFTTAQAKNMSPTNSNQLRNTPFLNLNSTTSPTTQPVSIPQNNNFSPPFGAIRPPQNPMVTSVIKNPPPSIITYKNPNDARVSLRKPSPLRTIKPKITPISRIQPQETPGNSSTGTLVFPNGPGNATTPGTAEQPIQLE